MYFIMDNKSMKNKVNFYLKRKTVEVVVAGTAHHLFFLSSFVYMRFPFPRTPKGVTLYNPTLSTHLCTLVVPIQSILMKSTSWWSLPVLSTLLLSNNEQSLLSLLRSFQTTFFVHVQARYAQNHTPTALPHFHTANQHHTNYTP